MIWRCILVLLLGLAFSAEAAGPFFRIESAGSSQYINLSAISAISHRDDTKANPEVTIWLIGSANSIRIPPDQQAGFWEAVHAHTQCYAAPNAPAPGPKARVRA